MSPTLIEQKDTISDRTLRKVGSFPEQSTWTSVKSYSIKSPQVSFTIKVRGEPWWLKQILSRYENLLALPENWDSYGAKPIRPEYIGFSLDLLDSIMGKTTPLPSVVPTVRGGIQFEWHTRGIDFEIEIVSSGKISVFVYDHLTGKEWESDLALDLSSLSEPLERISRPE